MTTQIPSCRWLSDERLLFSSIVYCHESCLWSLISRVHPAEDFGHTLLKLESMETSQQYYLLHGMIFFQCYPIINPLLSSLSMTIPLNDPMTLSFVEMNGASEISQGILGWISIISGWCFQTCFFFFFF